MIATASPSAWESVVAHLRTREAVVACARIALVVGTILTAINQLDTFIGGPRSSWLWVKVAANYVVPFCVSSVGYITAARRAQRAAGESDNGTGA